MSRVGFVKLNEQGQLKQKLNGEWSQHMLEQCINQERDYLLQTASTRLKPESISHFRKELDRLVKKFREQGYLENLSNRDGVKPIGLCFISGPEIINFPGPIPNID